MKISPKESWEQSLSLIAQNVSQQQYNTWFKPIVFEKYDEQTHTLLIQVPSPFVYEYLEENFLGLLSKVFHRCFSANVRLTYRVVTDKEHNLSQNIEADPADAVKPKERKATGLNQPPTVLDTVARDLDPLLNLHQTFSNYIEGNSNKLPRSVGLSIAEHPNNMQFNPMFIYGPSGCGKTHLVNAIGVECKRLYPQKRVLYISARLFQVQYTNAVQANKVNDFINFYQTIDMLIVDDIQEWLTAASTQNTFFHIFNHLFRNGKRIILASDRPPVDLQGMKDRLLTRFACGLIAELEKPNEELCAQILVNKIRHDGLSIPPDVIAF
ncbi:MAG: DnaA ATPase domain-containing protein, partial [Prevotella sp.]